MRQKTHFGSIYHIRIQWVQIRLQRRNAQYIIVVCPHNAFQRIEMHLQTPRNEFAHRKQIRVGKS